MRKDIRGDVGCDGRRKSPNGSEDRKRNGEQFLLEDKVSSPKIHQVISLVL